MTADAEETLEARLAGIVLSDPLTRAALFAARDVALPAWRIVAGAIYNTVWNHLTGRPSGYGVSDIDLAYFDGSDLSWDAEDRVIRRAEPAFAALPVPVEIRNQARVHLWFADRFGTPGQKLRSTEDGLATYASRSHAVGVRLLADDTVDIAAPFGLSEVFAMHVRPNRALDNAETHARKAARARELWPEITVDPW